MGECADTCIYASRSVSREVTYYRYYILHVRQRFEKAQHLLAFGLACSHTGNRCRAKIAMMYHLPTVVGGGGVADMKNLTLEL